MTTAKDVGTPTQVVHPWRAAVRTFLQTVVPSLVTFGAIVPMIIEAILVEQSIPDNLRVILLGIAGVVSAGAAILARIMAIPGVEKFLQKIKVGTGVEKERTEALTGVVRPVEGAGTSLETPPAEPVAYGESLDQPHDAATDEIDYEGTQTVDPAPVIPDVDGKHRGDYRGA